MSEEKQTELDELMAQDEGLADRIELIKQLKEEGFNYDQAMEILISQTNEDYIL